VSVNEALGRRSLQEVHVLQLPGIYRVSSTSETAYLIDSRAGEEGLSFCRQRGTTDSKRGEHDYRWHALVVLKCLPELDEGGARLDDAIEAAEPFVLRVGRRHYYVGETTFDVFWWLQRACTSIDLVEDDGEVVDGRLET
jgi:hypothetical protein